MGNVWLDKDKEIEEDYKVGSGPPTINIKIEIIYSAGGRTNLNYSLSKLPVKRVILVVPKNIANVSAGVLAIMSNLSTGNINIRWSCDPGPHEIIVEYEW